MLRIPKEIPRETVKIATKVAGEGESMAASRPAATAALIRHREIARAATASIERELAQMAQELFDWGVALRAALPLERLSASFGGRETDGPSVEVIRRDLWLPENDGTPCGMLRTKLDLCLHPDGMRLYSHHEWFDGHRTAGGGALNTPTAILASLHPIALYQIYWIVAEANRAYDDGKGDGMFWSNINAHLQDL